MNTRRKILPAFLGTIAFAIALYWIMISVQQSLTANTFIFGYDFWQKQALSDPLYRFFWFIGDMTEADFYKSLLGGFGLIIFVWIAYFLEKSNSKWKGFGVSYGTGLFPWIFLSATISLVISVVLYGNNISAGWIPTFVPFVGAPAAVVLVYGRGLRPAITGGVLAGLFTFPIANFLIQQVLSPVGLPAVSANVSAMWISSIIIYEICRIVPWMSPIWVKKEEAINAEAAKEETGVVFDEQCLCQKKIPTEGNMWFIRRVLAEFTEPHFYGSEIASIGMLLGVLISWILNPAHPVYGSGLLPAILLGQLLTGSIGIFLYYDRWQLQGWYPTYIPVVSVVPAIVLMFNGSIQSVIASAVIGALAGPPLAQLIAKRVPSHWHPYVGNVFSMATITALVAVILKYLPGFGLPW